MIKILRRLQRDIDRLQQEIERLRKIEKQVDGLTGWFAENGICEPVEGFVKQTQYLATCLNELIKKLKNIIREKDELLQKYRSLRDDSPRRRDPTDTGEDGNC